MTTRRTRRRDKGLIVFLRLSLVVLVMLLLTAFLLKPREHKVIEYARAWTFPEGYYHPETIQSLANSNDVVGIGKVTPNLSSMESHPFEPLQLSGLDRALTQRLQQRIATYPSILVPHVFVVNLQDHQYASIHGETAVPAASVIKLPILFEYFRALERGDLTPHQHLQYQFFHQALGSGMLQYRPAHQPLLAEWVATDMIQSSDNTCTNMLIYYLGGIEQLNQAFVRMGLRVTRLENWLPDLPGTNVISAKDMATLLYQLTSGHALSETSKAQAWRILTGTHNRRLIVEPLPSDVMVAHKTGDIGTSLGDAALIRLPNGVQYILVAQVERPYNHFSAKLLIQDLSKTVYQYMTAKYPNQSAQKVGKLLRAAQ